jgi:hypothetical protein
MANNFDELIPEMYAALKDLGREIVGFIPCVNKNTGLEGAAVGQTISIPVTSVGEPEDIEESMDLGDKVQGRASTINMTINKSRTVRFSYGGEETKGLQNGGNFSLVFKNQMLESMRKLVKEIEQDCAEAAIVGSSRAYGTAGNAPFGTAGDLSDFAQMARILDENGAPVSDRALVLSSTAFANLRGKQTILLKTNEAGSDEFLRTGYSAPVEGFSLFNSNGLKLHEKGAGTGYVTNSAEGYKIGDKAIAVDTGSGIVKAGDVVTFAGDNEKYVIGKGIDAPGTLEINDPGLMKSLADGVAMTSEGNYTPCIALHRNAIALITRPPAAPLNDAAEDVTYVTDPNSGLTFEVRLYKGRRCVTYEVGIAWGVKCVNPHLVATLMG